MLAQFLRIPANVGWGNPTNQTTEPLANGLGIAESVLLSWFWQGRVLRGKVPLASNVITAIPMIALYPTVIYSSNVTLDI